MQPLDTVYLQILKNLCTDSSDPVTLTGVDASALYRLAEKHCSLPFLLPYFETAAAVFRPQTADEADAALLLSVRTLYHVSLFCCSSQRKFPCFLLKGISLAANYPVPEYRKLGDLNLYIQ